MRTHGRVRGLPVKRMEFITNQDTPLVDFIVGKEGRHRVLSVIFEYLDVQIPHLWDVLTLTQWPEESLNFKETSSLFSERKKKTLLGSASMTPFIPIQGNWESFLRNRTPRLRKTQRNIANRIGKLEKIEIQCLRRSVNGSVMKEILQVAKRGWKYQEGKSLANKEDITRFFSILTEVGSAQGWLMVWFLKTDGFPIAMEYDVECKGKVFALRSDFDETYEAYSPGAYLECQILKWLFDNGYQEYSYGPGLNTYKLHWAEDVRSNIRVDLFNSTVIGKWAWELEGRIVPLCKRIRDSWRFPLVSQPN